MKKILYVATVDSHIKAFHLPYLKMLQEMGYEVHVATNGKEQFEYCDKKHTICIERNPFKFKNIKAVKQLKKIIDTEKFEIIHCHTPMGSVVTRLAAKHARKKYGTRVIYTAHGFHFYKGSPLINWILFYTVEWYLSKYTDTLITINKEDYNLAKKKFNKRCENIEYVPGVGIDKEKFNFEMTLKEKQQLKKSLGIKQDDHIIIFPARLDKNKNQFFLIKCMEQILKTNDKIHLLLPGIDELNGYYQKIVKRKGMDRNIHFLGYRTDIPKLMKISNLAVSSSLREGLPVNVIESFSCGLPVVALKCRGMNDLINNGENGYIDTDIENFIHHIKLILNNNKKHSKISKSNKEKSKNYEINSIQKKIKKIYNETLNKDV